MLVLRLALALAAGYLLGAVPVGWLVSRLYRGIDVRQFGSRRTGATNVLRTLGPGAAACVVIGDVAKGALAVVLARLILAGAPDTAIHIAEAVGALGALAGHNWSVFINWTGGRGVLVSTGAVLMLFPPVIPVCAAIAFAVIALSRLVSLGSLVGVVLTASGVIAVVVLGREPWPYAVFAAVGASVIIVQHRDNIERILAGTERKLGQPEAAGPSAGRAG